MKTKTILVTFAILAALVSGCSTTEEKGADLTGEEQNAITEGVDTRGYSDASEMAGSELTPGEMGAEFKDPTNPLSKHIIYFKYDSSQIQQDFIPIIAAHAQYLVTHPALTMVLEGHADERGSREYNIALGEQRAKSVARVMKLQGVADRQLDIVSYGEEKPLAEGHDEASWQQNRRVELVYQGRVR